MQLSKKWKEIPESARSAVIFGICSFMTSGISFFLTPLFTRIMSKEQYGIVVEYNSWHYIIEVFAVIGLASVGSFNVGLNEYRQNRDRYISSMLILANAATVLVFGAIFLAKNLFFPNLILPNRLLLIMLISFIFGPSLNFYLARKRYEYKYRKGAVVSIGSMIFIYGISILLVVFGGQIFGDHTDDSFNKILGAMIGTLVFAVPLYIILLIKGRAKVDLKMCRSMVVFALPLLPHYLAMHIMNGADRIMVSHLDSTESAAVYGVAAAIGTAASTVWIAVNGSLQPFIFNNLNDGNIDKIKKVTKLLVTGFSAICFCICLFAPEILGILSPEGYMDGVNAIPPIIGMSFLNALYNIYASVEFYHKKSVGIALATVIATVMNVVLNVIFIPEYGLVAAGYTSLVSNAALTFFHYIGYTKSSEKRIFSDIYFLIISMICIAGCICCQLVYDHLLIRAGVLLILAAIISFKRGQFKDILK